MKTLDDYVNSSGEQDGFWKLLCFWYNQKDTIVSVFVAGDDIFLVIEGMNSLANRKWGESDERRRTSAVISRTICIATAED